MANLPPELKKLKRFVREAKKTEKVSPVIAYYCRLYAVQEAMKLDESKKTAASNAWLMSQMSLLESNKVEVSREEAQSTITTMAHNVFKHADQIDRAGNANKSTAAAFNSAFVFYSILKQFGEREENIGEAAKYCMFKTADILKALREGRKPKPGAPGDDPENDEELNAELNAVGTDDAPSNSNSQPAQNEPTQPNAFSEPQQPMNGFEEKQPAQPSYQQPMQPQPTQPTQPAQGQPQYHAPLQPQANGNGQQPQYQQPMQPQSNGQNGQSGQNGLGGYYVNNAPQYNYQQRVQLPRFEKKVEACVEAEKTLKEAMAALRFEDVDTAIKKAQEAIAILQPHNR